jgi:hypothetical protein
MTPDQADQIIRLLRGILFAIDFLAVIVAGAGIAIWGATRRLASKS